MASKLTDLKTITMERKQILEILTGHCAGVASTKENGLVATKVYLDDLADELVNLFAIHNVVGQGEQLKAVQKLKDFAYEVCPLHREDDLEEIIGIL